MGGIGVGTRVLGGEGCCGSGEVWAVLGREMCVLCWAKGSVCCVGPREVCVVLGQGKCVLCWVKGRVCCVGAREECGVLSPGESVVCVWVVGIVCGVGW